MLYEVITWQIGGFVFVPVQKEANEMTKQIVIVGTLDTKGQELALVNELIEAAGLKTLVIDFGVRNNFV